MRRSSPVIFFIALAALVVYSQESDPSQPKVSVKYDRFRNATDVTINGSYARTNRGTTLFSLNASVPGERLAGGAPQATIIIAQMSDDWLFLQGPRTLRVILNRKDRETLGEMDRIDSRVLSGHVMEQLLLTIPFKTLVRLSESTIVEMQVGLLEIELTKPQMAALKDYVLRFK